MKSWNGILANLFGCVCLVAIVATGRTHAEASSQPNVVVIMADDLGYRDVGCYGCIDFTTPHIDALATAGIRCTDGYVSHPYCSPSRAGLLTGRYQQGFGHEHNPPYLEEDNNIGIDAGTRLLPDVLQSAGYTTGLIGKWHVGAGPPFRPVARGFTEFYGFLGGGHHYFKAIPQNGEYDGPIWRDKAPTTDKLTYLTDDLTTEAEAFIDRNKDKPFCLLLMYNAPHSPDHVTPEYMAKVEDIPHDWRRRYAALVQGVDAGVGRVVAKLAELSLTDDTLVVFLSDNGGRRGVADNRPLRGNKGWLHEGGLRVPFIFSMPGTLPDNTTFTKPVTALDLLPTALEMASLELPAGTEGVNLIPYLQGKQEQPPHPTLYWRVSGGDGYAVRHGDWKLVHDIGLQQPELYYLPNDLGEDTDLAANQPTKREELLALYKRWSAGLETPRWSEGHTKNTAEERAAAAANGSRQYPMPWTE